MPRLPASTSLSFSNWNAHFCTGPRQNGLSFLVNPPGGSDICHESATINGLAEKAAHIRCFWGLSHCSQSFSCRVYVPSVTITCPQIPNCPCLIDQLLCSETGHISSVTCSWWKPRFKSTLTKTTDPLIPCSSLTVGHTLSSLPSLYQLSNTELLTLQLVPKSDVVPSTTFMWGQNNGNNNFLAGKIHIHGLSCQKKKDCSAEKILEHDLPKRS